MKIFLLVLLGFLIALGIFTHGDNSQDNNKASVLLTETLQESFYSDIYPGKIKIIKGEITLERQKE